MTAALVHAKSAAVAELAPSQEGQASLHFLPVGQKTVEQTVHLDNNILPRGVVRLGEVTTAEVHVIVDDRLREDPGELEADTIQI